MMDRFLAMNPGTADGTVTGQLRYANRHSDSLRSGSSVRIVSRRSWSGYTVVEPSAVLSTHLQEVLRRNADRILGRQDTKKLIENLKKDYPGRGRGVHTGFAADGYDSEGAAESSPRGIPVRDLVTILEALADYARVTKNVDVLTEYVRHSLSETIARLYCDARG